MRDFINHISFYILIKIIQQLKFVKRIIKKSTKYSFGFYINVYLTTFEFSYAYIIKTKINTIKKKNERLLLNDVYSH